MLQTAFVTSVRAVLYVHIKASINIISVPVNASKSYPQTFHSKLYSFQRCKLRYYNSMFARKQSLLITAKTSRFAQTTLFKQIC